VKVHVFCGGNSPLCAFSIPFFSLLSCFPLFPLSRSFSFCGFLPLFSRFARFSLEVVSFETKKIFFLVSLLTFFIFISNIKMVVGVFAFRYFVKHSYAYYLKLIYEGIFVTNGNFLAVTLNLIGRGWEAILYFLCFVLFGIFFTLTCDNSPFVAGLGPKVDILAPVIEEILPVSGDYLKDRYFVFDARVTDDG